MSIDHAPKRAQGTWIVRPKPNPDATLRMFCFPHSGVGASAYRTWLTAFPSDIDICLVQPPGRESRWGEPAFTRLEDLVPSAAEAIASHLTLPYAFFGHSLGALASFEIARCLRRRGLPGPAWLFASSHRAPHLPNRHAELHRLPDAELVSEIRRQYDGIPQLVLDNPELLALMLPGLRADLTVFETYRYADPTPLDCPISAFGGRSDRRVTEAELDGWRERTRGRFRVRMMEGDHFYLQPQRDRIVAAIRDDLALAGAASVAAATR